MPIVLDSKNLLGAARDGKALKYVFGGNKLAWAANPPVQFDAGAYPAGATGSLSWTHTASAGATVVVTVELIGNNSVTACTYDGVAMTSRGSVNINNTASNGRVFTFVRTNVPGGAKTIAVTKSGFQWIKAFSVSYLNVDSADTSVTVFGSGTAQSHGPINVPHGGMVIQSFATAAGGSAVPAFTGLSGGTNRHNGTDAGGAMSLTASDSTTPATFKATTTAAPWASIATILRPKPILHVQAAPALVLTNATISSLTANAVGGYNGFGPPAGYNFYRNGVKQNATVQASPTYVFSGLTDGTEYELTVKAVNASNVESAAYPTLHASTLTDTWMNSTQRTAIDGYCTAAMSAASLPGVAISIRSPLGDYDKVHGYSSPPMLWDLTLDMHFRTASVTKSFTSTAILQQLDAENLALSDTLDTYVSGVPNGNIITIQHLLMMRSGLVDYASGSVGTSYFLNPELDYDEDDALATIRASTPSFAPGTGYLYSNSNYVLLGHILEAVTGKDIRVVLADVIAAAGLTQTSWPTGPTLPSPYAEGHTTGIFGGRTQRTRMNPDFLGASGALVTTISDMRKWGEVMRDGTLLSPTTHALWESTFCPVPYTFTPGPTHFGYGLGFLSFGEWFGIDGSWPGYECCVLYHPGNGTVIAAMGNFQSASLAALSNVFANIANYLYPGSLTSPGYTPC